MSFSDPVILFIFSDPTDFTPSLATNMIIRTGTTEQKMQNLLVDNLEFSCFLSLTGAREFSINA